MADPSSLYEFPLAGGIDEYQRSEVLDPATAFRTLENVRQDSRGALYKRRGFTSQEVTRLDGTSRSAGHHMFAYGEQTCVVDGHWLDTSVPALSANVQRARVPEPMPSRLALPYPGATPLVVDVAYANGYYISASLTFPAPASSALTLSVSVVEEATGAVVRHDVLYTNLSLTNTVKLAAVGTVVAVFYSSAANTIAARALDTTSRATVNAGWGTQTSLTTNWSSGNTALDVLALEDRFAIAYPATGGGTSQLAVKTFSTALAALESTTVNTSSTLPTTCALAGTNADTLWVSWNETSNIRVCGLTGNSLATVKSTTVTVITVANISKIGIVTTTTAAGKLVVSTDSTGAVFLQRRDFATSGGATTTTSSTFSWAGLALATRPFSVGGRYYCAVVPRDWVTNENDQKCHFVVDLDPTAVNDPLRCVANLAARQSIFDVGGGHAPSHYAAVSATKIAVVNVTERSFLSVNTGAAFELSVLDFASAKRWLATEFAGAMQMPGGVPSFFDGRVVDEMNFLMRPQTPQASIGGGTGVTATAIKYCVIWEKTDTSGNVYWSAPSDASSAVSPANQSVDILLPAIVVTSHSDSTTGNKIRASIYRSGDNGALPYRRVGTMENDLSTSMLFTDTTASVATEQKIYTPPGGPAGQVGSEQVHQCPPALQLLTVYNEMLCGIADDGVTLWYSAQRIVGEGPWFNDVFQLPISEGGEVTALASQDGTLFVFKRRAIFAINGTAPSANGSQGGMGEARRLAVDVGCIEPRSIVVTSLGIFFQSERGIELLTRGQSVEWIGAPVQDSLASYPIVSSATLDPISSVVYIELAASRTSGLVSGDGRALVFDLSLKQWVSVDRRTSSASVGDAPAQSSCMLWDGSTWRYGWLEAGGTVRPEQSSYTDGGVWVTMRLETGWIKLAGIQGYQQIDRVLLLASKTTNHDLTLSIGYNYAPTYADSRAYTAAEIAALAREQLEVTTGNDARCQALRVKISDAGPSDAENYPSSTGQAGTWIALTFEGIADRSRMRLPAGAR